MTRASKRAGSTGEERRDGEAEDATEATGRPVPASSPVGDLLEAARSRHGLTVRAMAKKLEISPPHYYDLVAARTDLAYDAWVILLNRLGLGLLRFARAKAERGAEIKLGLVEEAAQLRREAEEARALAEQRRVEADEAEAVIAAGGSVAASLMAVELDEQTRLDRAGKTAPATSPRRPRRTG